MGVQFLEPYPEVWGPHFWFTLHTISFFYPEYPTSTDMRNYKEFFERFALFIPCSSCQQHYKQFLKQYPIDGYLDSRDSLSRWVVYLHNKVNVRNGKPEWSYDDVVKDYRRKYSPQKEKAKMINIGVLAGLLGIGFYVYYNYFTASSQKRK